MFDKTIGTCDKSILIVMSAVLFDNTLIFNFIKHSGSRCGTWLNKLIICPWGYKVYCYQLCCNQCLLERNNFQEFNLKISGSNFIRSITFSSGSEMFSISDFHESCFSSKTLFGLKILFI